MVLFKSKNDEKKTTQFSLRIKFSDLEKIKDHAEAAKLTTSEYLTRRALNRPVINAQTTDIILELRKLADLQRELFNRSQSHKEEYLNVLRAIVHAIEKVPLKFKSTNN